ncbi:TonB-dependent siderophore receptor [Nitrosococcus halophilus]|uniref:TonB-dependent siderophore receptor n=1 Tax=Nitrosococcus halophilus TaxID=133539 RepID=UPI0002EEC5DB|nr:TonB-dependent receptor [Nitrosococcus halophilus]
MSFTRGGWEGFDGDLTSGQWDFNVPLMSSGALKVRFTGEVERTDSFINFQDLDRIWFNRINVPDIDALNPTFLAAAPEINPGIITFGQNFDVWAATFQDVVSITPYFDLMGGFRYTKVSGVPRGNLVRRVRSGESEVDNTSFQIGGTLHVTDSIHVFSGFAEGFQFNVVGQKADGSAFDPEELDQVEAGVKVDFPWGLSGAASFFEITRSNVTTPDRENPGFSVQTGEVRSTGGEMELAYQVTPQWYFQGGYAFIDAEITQSNAGDEGNRFQNIPEHQANLWTHYRFDNGPLRNLTLSAGMQFVGDRPLDNANTVDLPDFTTVDLGASYTYQNVKLELFVNNLLDKHYFTAADFGAAVFPGDPRSIVGRISLKY